jgi:hypothetical protein
MMQTAQEAQRQLRKLVREAQEESRREADELRTARDKAEQEGAPQVDQAVAQLRSIGLEQDLLSQASGAAAEKAQAREQLSQRLADASPAKSLEAAAMQLDDGFTAALAPETVKVLSPVYSAMFSAEPRTAQLEQAPQAATYIYSTLEHNPWAWAQGAGSGLFGTGVGETFIDVSWWFYFAPPDPRFYSIIPYTTYRGFYIVQSDDHWYDSHHARAVLTNSVNVYQYNIGKGWSHEDLLVLDGSNVNYNGRFDDTRSHYYTALLGANDPVWIQKRVRLYVYARGATAYSKLDFGTGAGNWIRTPFVYVY